MSSSSGQSKNASAEIDEEGREFLSDKTWKKMDTTYSYSGAATEYLDRMIKRVTGDLEGDDLLRVLWLSGTLFFVVGGYWLLRTIKDPIMSSIDGVEYIPQAKIASLFVVFALVVVYNKLLDNFEKQSVFYMMGLFYGLLFFLIGLLLLHPTIGLPNTNADPSRLLGWISYVSIESFGSMVVQCFWALVNSSVNVDFAKKNFGFIVAGAQIGSILGPSVATQADTIGVPGLYLLASGIMFCMVTAMYYYVEKFGAEAEGAESDTKEKDKAKGKEEGVMEGFYLFYEHDYVKGIFAVSSLYMIQVTVIDYMLKVLAKSRYEELYPNDPQAALKAFATFMGYFGICTNGISFMFSLFGTGKVIKHFGLTLSLISFPVFMLLCTVLVWFYPDIWMVFSVMMFIKAMSYALNNPTKEILYQMTSSAIKFKCKSWIDTFGQRSSKAAGSLITNAFADSLSGLVNYGSAVGILIAGFTIWVSRYMGAKFEELHASGEKVGESVGINSYATLEKKSGGDQLHASPTEDEESTSCVEITDDRPNFEPEKGGESTV